MSTCSRPGIQTIYSQRAYFSFSQSRDPIRAVESSEGTCHGPADSPVRLAPTHRIAPRPRLLSFVSNLTWRVTLGLRGLFWPR